MWKTIVYKNIPLAIPMSFPLGARAIDHLSFLQLTIACPSCSPPAEPSHDWVHSCCSQPSAQCTSGLDIHYLPSLYKNSFSLFNSAIHYSFVTPLLVQSTIAHYQQLLQTIILQSRKYSRVQLIACKFVNGDRQHHSPKSHQQSFPKSSILVSDLLQCIYKNPFWR